MSGAVKPMPRMRAMTFAVIGSAVVVAYTSLAAVQILMLNPLAAVPGLGLAQVYQEVAAAGESMGTGLVIVFLALGPLMAFALLVGVWRRPGWGPDWSWFPIWGCWHWGRPPTSGRASGRGWPWPTRSSSAAETIPRGLFPCTRPAASLRLPSLANWRGTGPVASCTVCPP